ncbi:branched-chain amino acid ABC transporter permease [Achromobacter aloeverae]|uniref:Branched-chain amino acid ABC transporter permease n=1 Tax=Achromobacter aloeverae TaxID=1750518 RepID=A0A4Q1HFW5_9BURK|nr:branched-chain amino acid ABC transporter permease [Achromobacter aloeverae]RXN85969.1 branched-chain amino acid ABC transporter permease [Achromobacter aloeverae]
MEKQNTMPASALSDARDAPPGRRAPLSALAVLVLLALPFLTDSQFYVHLAVLVCLNVVVVSGLSMLIRVGQLSLCHGAFMGVGAYVSVLLSMKLGVPFLPATAAGVLAAALLAWLLGSAILRLRGVYFVLITFAFGELVRLGLLEAADLTGGANGIANIPPASLFGFVLDTKPAFYCVAAPLAALSILFLWALFRTPRGHALDAVGQNPALAEASGLSVQDHQLFAFVAGSAMAGLAGAFLARYVGYVSPESFNAQVSIAAIIMLVVGGRHSVLGPLVGALIMTPLPELFRGAVQSQNIFYGITLILILKFLPQGIAGLFSSRRRGGQT